MGRVTGFASQTLTHFVLLKIKSWEVNWSRPADRDDGYQSSETKKAEVNK